MAIAENSSPQPVEVQPHKPLEDGLSYFYSLPHDTRDGMLGLIVGLVESTQLNDVPYAVFGRNEVDTDGTEFVSARIYIPPVITNPFLHQNRKQRLDMAIHSFVEKSDVDSFVEEIDTDIEYFYRKNTDPVWIRGRGGKPYEKPIRVQVETLSSIPKDEVNLIVHNGKKDAARFETTQGVDKNIGWRAGALHIAGGVALGGALAALIAQGGADIDLSKVTIPFPGTSAETVEAAELPPEKVSPGPYTRKEVFQEVHDQLDTVPFAFPAVYVPRTELDSVRDELKTIADQAPPVVKAKNPPQLLKRDEPTRLSKDVQKPPEKLVVERGSNPWKKVFGRLKQVFGRDPKDPEVQQIDEMVAKKNNIAVPTWGITGKVLDTEIPAGTEILLDDEVQTEMARMASRQ